MRPGRGVARRGGVLLVTAAAALLGVAAASAPLFVSAAGSEAIQRELAGPGEATLFELQVSGGPGDESFRAADAAVREHLESVGMPAPVATVATANVQVAEYTDPLWGPGQRGVVLLAVEDGVEDLPDAVAEADDGEVAITEQDAERLGVGAGDVLELRFALREQRVEDGIVSEDVLGVVDTEIVVGRVVEDIPREDVPDAWARHSSVVHYSIPSVVDPTYPPDPGPPALLADFEVAVDILRRLELHEGDGSTRGPYRTVIWGIRLADRAGTLEGARRLEDPVDEIHARVADPAGELATALAFPGPPGFGGGGPPFVRSSLHEALRRAELTTEGLARPVGALGLGGQALGLLAVGAAALLGARRRLDRARLWGARGVSPVVMGLRGTAACLPGVIAGVAGGWGLALVLIRWLGPGGQTHPESARAALESAALAGAAAVLLTAVVLSAASAAAARASGVPGRLPPIAETAALALAAVTFWQLQEGGGAVALSADGTAALDPLALALPLLLLVAAAGFGARLLRLLLRATGRWSGPRAPAGYLALRRLRSLTPATTALLAVAAVATGSLVLATSLAETSRSTIDEKAGLLAGADVSARLPRPEATRAALELDSVSGQASLVFRVEEALLGESIEIDLLAIDPASLGAVAYRPRGMSAEAFESLLARLEPAGGGPLPAVLASPGASAAGRGVSEATVEGHAIAVDLVEVVDAFPGMAADRPLLVVGDPDALDSGDPIVNARLASHIEPLLWVSGPGEEEQIAAELTAAGVDPARIVLAVDLREDPGLTPLGWTFDFLRAQAAAIGALGLAGLLGAFVSQQRQRALSTALAARMGLGRRARLLADVLELSVLLLSALALGTASGLGAARMALDQYDPMPALALPPALEVPGQALVAASVVAAVGAVMALVVTARAAARLDIADLLRRG